MKPHLTILSVAAALCVTACIPSVNPFYNPKDISFDEGLLGKWQSVDEDKREYWSFERDEGETYSLSVLDERECTGELTATLFRIGDHRFIDLIPSNIEYAEDQAAIAGMAMFPGHLLMHVTETTPHLKLAFIDYDWLEDHLEENPQALAHRAEQDSLLLTASTRQLQRFVLKHLKSGELFGEYTEMERIPPTEE